MSAARPVNRLGAVFLFALAVVAAPAAAQTQGAEPISQPVTIIAFGDSLTAGYGLPAEQGFAPRLEAWLRANGAPAAKVVNAGVSGDTTSGGLARLDWTLSEDADAVILELGANDMLRGVSPDIARDNLDQMLSKLGARDLPTLLVGMRSLGNWGEDYVESFESIYPDLAEKHGVPLYPFMLEGLAGDPSLSQPDRLHPNEKGVEVMVANIGPAALDLIRRVEAAQ